MTEKQEAQLQLWAERIKEKESSGLSFKEWNARTGFTKDAYYYWKKRLRKIQSEIPSDIPNKKDCDICRHKESTEAEENTFVEISAALPDAAVPAVPPCSNDSAVIRCGKLSVEVRGDMSESFIRILTGAIKYA